VRTAVTAERQSTGRRDVPDSVTTHPRKLGRAWLQPAFTAQRIAREAGVRQPSAQVHLPRASPEQVQLVPTAAEALRALGLAVHQLSAAETAAWFAQDERERAEARRAIREAVREQGGGQLRDHRGRLLERIDA
jgi:hypothetical protein